LLAPQGIPGLQAVQPDDVAEMRQVVLRLLQEIADNTLLPDAMASQQAGVKRHHGKPCVDQQPTWRDRQHHQCQTSCAVHDNVLAVLYHTPWSEVGQQQANKQHQGGLVVCSDASCSVSMYAQVQAPCVWVTAGGALECCCDCSQGGYLLSSWSCSRKGPQWPTEVLCTIGHICDCQPHQPLVVVVEVLGPR
jgi:hypothetical protein